MGTPEQSHEADRRTERRWAIVQIILGLAQVMTATFAAVVLLSHKNDALAIGAGAVVLSLVVTSRLLFRSARRTGR